MLVVPVGSHDTKEGTMVSILAAVGFLGLGVYSLDLYKPFYHMY